MENIFISIIIPTFNSEKNIKNALDSIFSQKYREFEVLIMDGLSSDNTREMVRSYLDMDRRLSFISESDNGIYDAMNKGIDRAKGEWIYFLGSDDYLINDEVLTNVIEIGDLNNQDFVYGNVFSEKYGAKYDGEFDNLKIINENICHQALFVRAQVFKRLGKFNSRYRILADHDFNLRCMFNKNVKKKHIDLTIAYYAPGGSSATITDEVFIKDKNWLLLKYGFASFSWKQRIDFCGQFMKEVIASVKKWNAKK